MYTQELVLKLMNPEHVVNLKALSMHPITSATFPYLMIVAYCSKSEARRTFLQ